MDGRKGWILIFVMTLALVAETSQAQTYGRVHRLAEGRRGHLVETTDLATIWKERTPRYAQLGGSLYDRELLRLERGLRLDLRIDRPDLVSRHVMASDAGTLAQPALDFVDVAFDQQGVYALREDPRRLKGLELLLVKGMMWLELQRGGIAVRAAGTVTHVNGTEVVFVVGRDSTEGVVYLRHGQILFPDFPELRVLDGQAWRLQAGQPPQLLDLPAAQQRRWRDIARYNSRTVWSKVWWKRALFYVPAGALVTGGIAYLLTRDGSGGRNGPDPPPPNFPTDIIITIPD